MRLSNRGVVAVALGTVYLAWGGTYPAIRLLDRSVPPLIGMGVRFLTAGCLLCGWLAVRGHGPRRPPATLVARAAVIGVLILGDIGILAIAELHVPAGLAALIIASVPLWAVTLRLASRDRIPRRTRAAVIIGLGGIAFLVSPGGRAGATAWLLVLLAAAVIEAIGEFAAQRVPLPENALVSTAVQLLAAGAVLIVAGAARGELGQLHPDRLSPATAGAFAYLVLPGSLLAYSALVWLLKNTSLSTASTYAYANPVVALVLGSLLLHELLSVKAIIAAAIVVLSVAAVVSSEPTRRTTPSHPTASDTGRTATSRQGRQPTPHARPRGRTARRRQRPA